MWNRILTLAFLVFLLFCAFTLGRYYQIDFLLNNNDSVTVQRIIDKNCVKL